jgi:hypothetical protein
MPAIIVSTDIDGEYIDPGDLTFTPGPRGNHAGRFRYDSDFVQLGYAIEQDIGLDSAPQRPPGATACVRGCCAGRLG